jgi:hypothetical protein
MNNLTNSPRCAANDSRLAGKLACHQISFGPHNRFSVAAVHTRAGRVEWFVWDTETSDLQPDHLPVVIRQESTFAEAIAGLKGSDALAYDDRKPRRDDKREIQRLRAEIEGVRAQMCILRQNNKREIDRLKDGIEKLKARLQQEVTR